MKLKIESTDQIYLTEKKVVLDIINEFGGSICAEIEPYFDGLSHQSELYISTFLIKLPYDIEIYIRRDIENNIMCQISLLKTEINAKSIEMNARVKSFLLHNNCVILSDS